MTSTFADDDRWEGLRFDLDVEEPADVRVLAVVAVGGLAFDAGVRSGVVSVGGWMAVCGAALGLAVSGRLRTTASRTCALGAVLMALPLMVRVSPWLTPFNVVAALALLGLAAMLARDGRLDDLTVALLAGRAIAAVGHAVAAPAFVAVPLRRLSVAGRGTARRGRAVGVARGLVLALPVVLVLGALLASADRIFASLLSIHVPHSGSVGGHVALIGVGAAGLAGLLRLASARPQGALPETSWRLGPVEWTTVLASVVTLFGVFAVVQVVSLGGGGRRVLETHGLTYAGYARSGYFQLLAATVLTGLVLGALAVVSERSRPGERARWIALSELTVALTFLILVVAVRRLGLYEEAYGWTMLRLMVKASALWIGLVLVLLAVRLAGVGRGRAWFVPASVAAGLAVLTMLNVVNPEAAVVRHNLARSGVELDPAYLATLSDDALPALSAGVDRLSVGEQSTVRGAICGVARDAGFLGWNLSTARADRARADLCSRTF